jgi:hypothetical protein
MTKLTGFNSELKYLLVFLHHRTKLHFFISETYFNFDS